MNLIIELKRNRQTKCESRTNNDIHGEVCNYKRKREKITHVPIKKSQHQWHVTTKPCKKHTTELCVEKLFFKDNNLQEL